MGTFRGCCPTDWTIPEWFGPRTRRCRRCSTDERHRPGPGGSRTRSLHKKYPAHFTSDQLDRRPGFEPGTSCFKGRRSATELPPSVLLLPTVPLRLEFLPCSRQAWVPERLLVALQVHDLVERLPAVAGHLVHAHLDGHAVGDVRIGLRRIPRRFVPPCRPHAAGDAHRRNWASVSITETRM